MDEVRQDRELNKPNIGVARLLSFKVVIAVILFLSAWLFIFIAHEAVYEKEKTFDDAVFAYVSSISTPGFISTM
jgi:hypothetical protein